MSEEENTEIELDAVPMFEEDEKKPEFAGLMEPEEELVSEEVEPKDEAKVGVGQPKEELLVTTDTDLIPKQFITDGKVDVDRLAESYTSLQKKMRQKEVDSGVSGIPDSIENYILDKEYDYLPEDVMSNFATQALEKGVNSDQLNWLYGILDDAYHSDMSEDSQTMKDVWKEDYTKNLTNANKAWKHLESSGSFTLSAEDVKNNPTALNILASIGAEFGEDSKPVKAGNAGAKDAEAEIDKIMESPDYWESPKLQAKVQKLMASL